MSDKNTWWTFDVFAIVLVELTLHVSHCDLAGWTPERAEIDAAIITDAEIVTDAAIVIDVYIVFRC